MAYFRGFGNRSKGEARSAWSRARAQRRMSRVVPIDSPRFHMDQIDRYRNAAMREATAYKQFRHVSLEDDILQMLAQRVPEDVALKITDYVGGYE